MKKKLRLKKKWKIIFSILGIFNLLFITTKLTYARYESNIKVNVNEYAGSLICTANVVNTGISNNGYAYFDIKINNYDEDDNITETKIKYNIQITNDEESEVEGLYRWTDAEGYSNGIFELPSQSRDYLFGNTEKESQIIRIEVTSNELTSENILYNANVNCYQAINVE